MAMVNARPNGGQPMMEMNTTPLIDVLLVLLIMFIMTIPIATNTVEVYLGSNAPPKVQIFQANRLVVTSDDSILWNGSAIDRGELAAVLRQTARMPVEPALQLEPQAGANYDLALQVIAAIKRAGVTNFGFVGNERFAEFARQ